MKLTKIIKLLPAILMLAMYCSVSDIPRDNELDPSAENYANTDSQDVNTDANALSFSDFTFGTGDSEISVTQNFTVPTSGANGTTISWSSDDISVSFISGAAIVTRPVFGAGDAVVTLTATIEKNGVTETKTFQITVLEAPATDAESVSADKAALDFSDFIFGTGDSETSVTQNFSVPTSGSSGTTISWSSDDGSIVFIDGSATVTQPTVGGNVSVTLTATIEKNGTTDTKTFAVTVITADITPPGELTMVYANADDGKIILNWQEPLDIDYQSLEITWFPGGSTPVTVDKGISLTHTADGLTNGTSYTFLIKTIDTVGNISAGITFTVQPNASGTAAAKKIHSLNGIRLAEAYVPSKSFATGTDDSGAASVSHNFWIAETETTYALWYEVYTWAVANGYTFANAGTEGNDGIIGAAPTAASQEPVTNINWRDAMVFTNALTEYYNTKNGTSLKCVYTIDAAYSVCIKNSADGAFGSSVDSTVGSFDNPYVNSNAKGFRLVATMEWELAARYIADLNNDGDILDAGEYYPGSYASGATADYNNATATGLVAWYNPNSNGTTHDTATKAANAIGLYDMSGNVWEWVFDWHPSFIGSGRVLRGGDQGNTADYMRVGVMIIGAPYQDEGYIGFRIARTEPPKVRDRAAHNAGGATFNMRYVPGGLTTPTGIDDSGTATVANDYLIAETEVTYELWYAVKTWADSNSYSFANTGIPGNDGTAGTETTSQEPVTTINWRDAMVFSNALTEYYNAQNGTSLACVYTTDAAYTTCIRTSTNNTTITYGTLGSEDDPYVNPNAKGFRLPTNDEWELAARYIDDTNSNGTLDAGEYYPGAYASGATADYNNATATGLVAWYSDNSGSVTHNVAAKAANALGLYDMSGNVWEWAFGWHPLLVGTYRVLRSGSWYNTASNMQVGYVHNPYPYNENSYLGFRFARTP